MRLIKADCFNYKRLRNWVDMDLGAKLICIVGPNEAGKSSFLDALEHLDRDDDYSRQERTRGVATSEIVQVRARFLLDEEDKALLADIPEAASARQLVMWKKT